MIPPTTGQQHWLTSALGQLNDVVLVTEAEPIDLPGPRIVYANDTFERQTGYSASEVIGQSPRILQGPRSSRLELQRLRKALERWESCRICITNYRKDGVPFDVEFDVIPFANEEGWYTHWVSLQRDVTERTLATEVVNAATSVEALVQGAGVELAEFTGADGCTICTRHAPNEPFTVQHVRYRDGREAEQPITPPAALKTALARALALQGGVADHDLFELDLNGLTVRGTRRATDDGCEVLICVWRKAPGPWELADQLVPPVVARVLAKYESLMAQHDRARLTRELEHARKLEAVGRMAGGVAHDFNNLLTVIVGNLEFLRAQLADQLADEPMELGEVLHAAERARGLVGQLMSISHRMPGARESVDVGALVESTAVLLQRTIGVEIAVRTEITQGSLVIDGDATLLRQALLNLALNARDAIESSDSASMEAERGTITLSASVVSLSKTEARRWAPLRPGKCVQLTVSDTGPGMSDEILEKAFEPFFTTKDVGQGTGLGLSSVLGTVKNLGGAVRLEAAEPHGVLARMRFPLGSLAAPRNSVEQLSAAAARPLTVLVVDDEEAVRKVCVRVLQSAGHRVLEAEHGEQALQQLKSGDAAIDGVVTDVRMPVMGGIAMAREIRRTHPSLPILFMSGNVEPGFLHEFGPTAAMLSKPFAARSLLKALGDLAK